MVVNCEVDCRVRSCHPRRLEGIKGRSHAPHPAASGLHIDLAGVFQESTVCVHDPQAIRASRVVGDLMRPLVPEHVARNNQIHEPPRKQRGELLEIQGGFRCRERCAVDKYQPPIRGKSCCEIIFQPSSLRCAPVNAQGAVEEDEVRRSGSGGEVDAVVSPSLGQREKVEEVLGDPRFVVRFVVPPGNVPWEHIEWGHHRLPSISNLLLREDGGTAHVLQCWPLAAGRYCPVRKVSVASVHEHLGILTLHQRNE